MHTNDFFDHIRIQLKSGNKLILFIAINVIVFLAIQPFALISFLFGSHELKNFILNLIALPADISEFMIRPWTILTYMFTQESIWHLAFNMLTLYWFGNLFMQFLGSRRLVHVYFMGGILGGIVYILAYNTFPVFKDLLPVSILLGASASILAITFAAATYQPNYNITLFLIGHIRLKYLAFAMIIIDLLSIPNGNAGGHIAHIGGALFGFLYVFSLRNGFDFSKFLSLLKMPSFKRKARMKVHYKKPLTDEEYVAQKNEKQKQIDRILEKISQSGYDSLSKEEKELLFNAGKR